MDDNLSEKIRAVLSDPDAASKIAAIASSLTGGTGAGDNRASAPPPEDIPAMAKQPSAPASKPFPRSDPRMELLRAMRPLVAEHKRSRIDSLLQIAAISSLLGSFGNRSERS